MEELKTIIEQAWEQRASLEPGSAPARVGEAVNNVQMVYGVIPKRLFRENPPYWQ